MAKVPIIPGAPRERGIVFGGPTVRAILDGQTVERRLVKPSPGLQRTGLTQDDIQHVLSGEMTEGPCGWRMYHPRAGTQQPLGWVRSPFGGPGDRVWVREQWGSADHFYQDHENDDPGVVAYAADRSAIQFHAETPRPIPPWDIAQWNWSSMRWRPSASMPRWASRITLAVADVRVERLHDITEEDARAEGLQMTDVVGDLPKPFNTGPLRYAFALRWSADHKRAPWPSNPWVWRIEFKIL